MSEEQKGLKDEHIPQGYDLILETLMNMARMNKPTPITVHSGGVIITGMLISEAEYLKEFAGGTILEAMKRRVEGDERLKAMAEQATDDPTERAFLHIKDAQFILPNGQTFPQGASLMWRGRVSSIDGYIPAQLKAA